MSSAEILNEVTSRLSKLLTDRFQAVGLGSVQVTNDSPLSEEQGPGQGDARLNLFLYMLRKDEFRQYPGGIDMRNETGFSRVLEPTALKLYYLISAFGADHLVQQRLLGYAIQVMAENPSLTKEEDDSEIAPERMQVVMLNLDMVELNAIWNTTTLVRETSIAYEVRPVLIEPDPDAGKPKEIPEVQDLATTTLGELPMLDPLEQPVLRVGTELVLHGRGFDATNAPDPENEGETKFNVWVVFRQVVGREYKDSYVELLEPPTAHTVRTQVPNLEVDSGVIWVRVGSIVTGSHAFVLEDEGE